MNRSDTSPQNRRTADDAGAHRETEIKLQIEPRYLPRLRRANWLKGLAAGRPNTQQLRATYFDTVDLKLRQAGLILRVRKEGRRFVQSVKARDAIKGAFTRQEWETVVPKAEPSPEAVARLADAKIVPHLKPEDLVPVFQSSVRRIRRELTPKAGNRVAFDVDVGEIKAGESSEPICEVELELLSGEPRHVFDLALKLVDEVPARLSTDAKSDRGYALLAGHHPEWRKATPLVLDPAAPADEALARMIINGVDHLNANEACTLARVHIEGIHQMRVALRRLRSAFAIFKHALPSELAAELTLELKWLIGELGPARDWDVFIADVLDPMSRWQADDPGLGLLREEAVKRQDEAYARAHEAIRSTRYTRLLLRLAAWAEGRAWRAHPVSDATVDLYGPTLVFANRLIDRRHRRLLKAGRHFKQLTDEERHRLRIRVKKLRYAVEFFQSVYPRKRAAGYRDTLVELQDGLGGLNDLAVARELLGRITAAAEGDEVKPLHAASGMVIGWHAHVAQDHLKGINKTWKRFTALKPFWV
jgi:inorganic triphosphatase YgiF